MAVNGVFPYETLYDSKLQNYHRRIIPNALFTVPVRNSTTKIIPRIENLKWIPSTTTESNTSVDKSTDTLTFVYFYWFLIFAAILLIVILLLVFIRYCRNGKTCNFRLYRASKQRVHPDDVHCSKSSPSHAFSTPPCPSKSLEILNNHMYRQEFSTTDSPQIMRFDVCRQESLSTFTRSTPTSFSTLQSRLSTRSCNSSLKMQHLYESQELIVNMDDETDESP